MIALAHERGVAGRGVDCATRLTGAVARVWGKALPMNVSMAIAATLRDLDVPASLVRGVPILARTAGLLAHLGEEAATPIGFFMASQAEAAIGYVGRGAAMSMVEPEIEAAPWDEQAGRDDSLYRAQIAYLFERSRFYRDKLARAGFETPAAVGGLAKIAELPFTEKDELRRSRDARRADRDASHRLARRNRAHLFDQRHDGNAELYSADRIRPRSLGAHVGAQLCGLGRRARRAARLHLQRRAVRRRRGARRLRPARPLSRPRRHGQYGKTDGGGEAAAAERRRADPVLCAASRRMGQKRGFDLAGSSVKRLMVAGEPGGGEPTTRAKLEAAWGASVTEAMGIGDISVSLWGECEAKAGMHFSGRGFVHFELIDPASGAAVPTCATAPRASSSLTHLVNRSAPLLRFRTRDHVRLGLGRCACGRTAPRVRCIGRTDDMLIVRGVNVFPSAVREVVNQFAPDVTGVIMIRPRAPGVRQEPPLPVTRRGRAGARGSLAERIRERIRDTLLVTTEIELVRGGKPAAQRIQVQTRGKGREWRRR